MSVTAANTMTTGSKTTYFQNTEGIKDTKCLNYVCRKELESAGIDCHEMVRIRKGMIVKEIMGVVCDRWSFERAWSYWVAEGPGLPPKYANALHKKFGKVVRVEGHCACPSPKSWMKGFAVGMYHVDTQEGLKALADALKKCAKDASKK